MGNGLPGFGFYQQWTIARLKGEGRWGEQSQLGWNLAWVEFQADQGVCVCVCVEGIITGNGSDKSALLDERADAEIITFGRKTLYVLVITLNAAHTGNSKVATKHFSSECLFI